MKLLAATVAAVALAAAPAADAHELTPAQKNEFQRRLDKSRTVVAWWNGRGRWALHARYNACWQIRPSSAWRHRRICRLARTSLQAHAARIERLTLLLAPPRPVYLSPQAAICSVFGPYCQQALAVAQCESGFSTTAQNGQYWGIFQEGGYARATYGFGWTALEEARSAYRYFVAVGHSWDPWECKP